MKFPAAESGTCRPSFLKSLSRAPSDLMWYCWDGRGITDTEDQLSESIQNNWEDEKQEQTKISMRQERRVTERILHSFERLSEVNLFKDVLSTCRFGQLLVCQMRPHPQNHAVKTWLNHNMSCKAFSKTAPFSLLFASFLQVIPSAGLAWVSSGNGAGYVACMWLLLLVCS